LSFYLTPGSGPADALGQAASWGLPDAKEPDLDLRDAGECRWGWGISGGAVGQTNDPIKKHYEQEKTQS
jgi:hypothetical protein